MAGSNLSFLIFQFSNPEASLHYLQNRCPCCGAAQLSIMTLHTEWWFTAATVSKSNTSCNLIVTASTQNNKGCKSRPEALDSNPTYHAMRCNGLLKLYVLNIFKMWFIWLLHDTQICQVNFWHLGFLIRLYMFFLLPHTDPILSMNLKKYLDTIWIWGIYWRKAFSFGKVSITVILLITSCMNMIGVFSLPFAYYSLDSVSLLSIPIFTAAASVHWAERKSIFLWRWCEHCSMNHSASTTAAQSSYRPY